MLLKNSKLKTYRFFSKFLIPDDNPGDLDVLINKINFNKIELILKNNDFNYYKNYNTNQILFNKYVSNVALFNFIFIWD